MRPGGLAVEGMGEEESRFAAGDEAEELALEELEETELMELVEVSAVQCLLSMRMMVPPCIDSIPGPSISSSDEVVEDDVAGDDDRLPALL